MNKWIFCFQKSVALVLSKLLRTKTANGGRQSKTASASPASLSVTGILGSSHLTSTTTATTYNDTTPAEDARMWLRELGHGHGRHAMMMSKRASFKKEEGAKLSTSQSPTMSNSILSNSLQFDESNPLDNSAFKKNKSALTLSRIGDPLKVERNIDGIQGSNSTLDLTQLYVRESGQVSNGQGKPPKSGGPSGLSHSMSAVTSFMTYARPPIPDDTNFHRHLGSTPIAMSPPLPTSCIAIPMAPVNGKYTSSGIANSFGSADAYSGQQLAASYHDRSDSVNLLDDEAVAMRLQLMSAAAAATDNLEELEFDDHTDGERHVSGGDGYGYSSKTDHLSSNYDTMMMFDFDDAPSSSSDQEQDQKSNASSGSQPLTARPKSEVLPSFVAAALDVLATEIIENGSNISTTSRPRSARINYNDRIAVQLASSSSSHTTNSSVPSLSWRSGYCTINGPRSQNDDRIVALPEFLDDANLFSIASGSRTPVISQGYFAVYDGHCGYLASVYMQEYFHTKLSSHSCFWSDLQKAIFETVIQIDREFLDICRDKKIQGGTTALGAFIRGSMLLVYNVGDCQAFLCSNGIARCMSEIQKPSRPDETERVIRANGWITEEKELYMGRLHRMDILNPLGRRLAENINFVTIHRVCGDLAVSRSIGDPDYKNIIPGQIVSNWFPWPDDHNQVFNADLVIPDPEFRSVNLNAQDEFMVLASDGLWDVVSGEDVIPIVREKLRAGDSPEVVAEELCQLAIGLGSSDNISVVIVEFSHS